MRYHHANGGGPAAQLLGLLRSLQALAHGAVATGEVAAVAFLGVVAD